MRLRGILALGAGRLVSLHVGHSLETSTLCSLKCFVILDWKADCSWTIITTQMKAQDCDDMELVCLCLFRAVCVGFFLITR